MQKKFSIIMIIFKIIDRRRFYFISSFLLSFLQLTLLTSSTRLFLAALYTRLTSSLQSPALKRERETERERERERESVCVRERGRGCLCACQRGRELVRESVCECECVCVCACMCVCATERQSEREWHGIKGDC